jgi:hypothetical protein
MAHETEIAALEEILNSATQSASVDGVSATFDLASARKRLAELKAADAGTTWPRTTTIKMNSGFETL